MKKQIQINLKNTISCGYVSQCIFINAFEEWIYTISLLQSDVFLLRIFNIFVLDLPVDLSTV